MTRRQRILAVVGALALIGATLSTGVGHGDDLVVESSVTVLPGALRTTLTWVSPEKQCTCTTAQDEEGQLVLRVLDERGYATGWSVSLSSTDSSEPGGPPGSDQLVLVPGAVFTVRGNPELAGHATFQLDPVGTTPSLLWSVPIHAGDREYDLPLVRAQGLPSDQQTNGLYTVVVNIGGSAP